MALQSHSDLPSGPTLSSSITAVVSIGAELRRAHRDDRGSE